MNVSDEERRSILGIVYCHTCEQDTMPDERTGLCFFCQTQLLIIEVKEAAA